MLEGWLREDEWAVGDGFTAVDAYLLPFWVTGEKYLEGEMARFGKLEALMRRVKGRESVAKALRREEEIKEELGGAEAFGEMNR